MTRLSRDLGTIWELMAVPGANVARGNAIEVDALSTDPSFSHLSLVTYPLNLRVRRG